MKKVLIYYDTVEGQTSKIAECIAETLASLGFTIHLARAGGAAGSSDDGYAGVVLGAPVHLSRFPDSFRRGVRERRDELVRAPIAFFSVCLGILEKKPKTLAAEKKIVSDFLVEARLSPVMTEIFPGAIKYSQYGWLKKKILRAIARKAGEDTSYSRDYEYTDWDRVRAFARSFAGEIEERSRPIQRFPEGFSAARDRE